MSDVLSAFVAMITLGLGGGGLGMWFKVYWDNRTANAKITADVRMSELEALRERIDTLEQARDSAVANSSAQSQLIGTLQGRVESRDGQLEMMTMLLEESRLESRAFSKRVQKLEAERLQLARAFETAAQGSTYTRSILDVVLPESDDAHSLTGKIKALEASEMHSLSEVSEDHE